MKPVKLGVSAIAIVLLALGIIGVATGSAPKGDPAPTGAALVASKTAIANGSAKVKEGEKEFKSEHCTTCHAIAAIGANGNLGPRMDTQDDPTSVIAENIAEPRKDIADGYEAKLMPTDYTKRMGPDEIKAVAAFVKAASAGTKKGS